MLFFENERAWIYGCGLEGGLAGVGGLDDVSTISIVIFVIVC